MQDRERSRRAESKDFWAQPAREQPRERLVQVRLALLSELQDHQDDLDSYVRAYIDSRELYDLCAKIRSRLERGKQEPLRLGDALYWEGLRDRLDEASKLSARFPASLRENFREPVEKFERALHESRKEVTDAMHAPLSAKGGEIASAALRNTDDMRDAVEVITEQSKMKAGAALEQIKTCTARIFERIAGSAELLTREPFEQTLGFEEKLKQEEMKQKKEFRGPGAEVGSPGSTSKITRR